MPEKRTDLELANEFSEFFSSKIKKISESLDHYPLYILEERNVPKLRKFRAIDPEEVMQIVISMPPKHCDLDPIPAQIFKKLVPYLITELTVIVNKSLTEGEFATSWKTSVTKPLIKSTKLERVRQSYRPVGNWVFISKIMEQCMLTQFNEHCGLNQLMPNYQSAYQKFHSCETSLINLVNTILWNMESQKVMSCLIMDLSAVFNTVNFQILEDVLEKEFGITEAAWKWYHNYLSPGQVIVNVNGTYSLPISLTCGVVQGSVSGPVAYSAYASTLKYTVQDTDQDCDSENISELNLNGFADDHSLNMNFNPNEEGAELNTKHRMESKMCDINTWMNGNRLKMNSSKTKLIYFASRQQLAKTVCNCIDICRDNVTISEVIKLLGIYLNKNLTFKQHIMTKCKTAMFNIQRIKHIRKYLTKEACETLVMGLVTSHLDYCNSLLYGLPAINMNKLQHVQNIASKLILQKSKYESNKLHLMELHWLPICARIEFKMLVYVYNCLDNAAPVYMKKMPQRYSTREGLRSNNMECLLVIPKTKRKTFADRSSSICGP